MEMTSYDPGVPSWVDLGSPDPDGAATFYGGLFGWESPEGPPEAGGYRLFELRGKPVAGLGPQMNPGPPYWTTYVSVDDASAIVPRVLELGGQVIVEPMDVLDVGSMAVFADTTGAIFSVWQPKLHIGANLVNEPGTLGWNELVSTDVDASITFYGGLFGWGAETHGEGASAYTEWKLAGRSIGGLMAKPEMMPAEVPAYWGVYFIVDDADASAARVTELGGTVVMPPMDIEPGRFALVTDPQGAMFSVMKLNPELAG
jgi:predicted enzyme related to lactoylglutathione lyase